LNVCAALQFYCLNVEINLILFFSLTPFCDELNSIQGFILNHVTGGGTSKYF
jgi:hypothetical protein